MFSYFGVFMKKGISSQEKLTSSYKCPTSISVTDPLILSDLIFKKKEKNCPSLGDHTYFSKLCFFKNFCFEDFIFSSRENECPNTFTMYYLK